MAAFQKMLGSICKRPQMYVGYARLFDVSHYLYGYCHCVHDLDAGPSPLDGFREWVGMRFEIDSPAWHWTRILLHTYGSDEKCFEMLPDLYDEFLADRERLGKHGIVQEARRRLIARYGRPSGAPEETDTTNVLNPRVIDPQDPPASAPCSDKRG